MIDRELEISKIARIMCGGCRDSYSDTECFHGSCPDWNIAERIYDAGYRCLPVNLHDKVYVNYKGNTYPVYVTAIRIDNKKHNNRICVSGTFHFSEDYAYDYSATFTFESVGKTLFRTAEEAERSNSKRS